MKKKILCVLLAVFLIAVPLSGCGGPGGGVGGTTNLRFWGYGDQTVKDAMDAMVDAYNAGQGKTDGIEVKYTHRDDTGYVTALEQASVSRYGPDVFFAWDRYFKKWANQGFLADLQPYVDASVADGTLDLDGIWEKAVSRFRYDPVLNISGDTEDLYGLPVDNSPTALIYNKDAMRAVGVTIISVAEDQLEAWNKGGIADKYGQKKSDIAALNGIDVPAKGYFRNDNNVYQSGETWVKPASGTVLVFNDQIAMNWDEVEDLGHLMTGTRYNDDSITNYGYFTEWWFNYGWAVGGDCVVDMSGNGSWAYGHADSSANYIVNEGKTYTGEITGTVYQAGETLEFLDKMDCAVGDVIRSDDKGGYTKNGTTLREVTDEATVGIRSEVVQAAEDRTLTELPSIREAFVRFCKLSGVEGRDLNISAPPTSFTTTSSIIYFTGGNVGMIVERALTIPIVNEYVGDEFEWACAPLPVFKEYSDPSDPQCDDVIRQGKLAGHSDATALAIREGSENKDAAWKFVRWMVSAEAQAIRASYGFVPNQATEVDAFYNSLDPENKRNLDAFVNAADYETPGDWWYMVNKDWIDVWAGPLNGDVRNGKLSYDEFFDRYVRDANNEVEKYGNYEGELGKVKNYFAS